MKVDNRKYRRAQFVILGVVLAVLGALALVAAGCYITGSGIPLFYLLVLGLNWERITKVNERTLSWQPLLRGGFLCFVYLALAGFCLLTRSIVPFLVGLIANWAVDPVCDNIEKAFGGAEPQNALEDFIEGKDEDDGKAKL